MYLVREFVDQVLDRFTRSHLPPFLSSRRGNVLLPRRVLCGELRSQPRVTSMRAGSLIRKLREKWQLFSLLALNRKSSVGPIAHGTLQSGLRFP